MARVKHCTARMAIALIAALFGIPFAAVAQQNDASRKAGELVLEPASLITPEGKTYPFEMGTLYVPENRTDPNNRIVGIGFARFKARDVTSAPPTFHLPGGPGNSYLAGWKPGENRGRSNTVEFFGRVADVVLVDQRGFSQRGEILKFTSERPQLPLDQPGSLARSTAAFAEQARTVVANYAKRGIDLRGYTVQECAEDVDDLRRALGYQQITLVGQSFGSQWSFAIMRRNPETVARALLSGVEPLDCGYDMPSHVLAAIQRICWTAEKDSRLVPYLPPGGLMAAAREVMRRLKETPVKVPVQDARSGATVTIVLGPEDFQESLLTVGRNEAGPAFLLSLYHGRYDTLARSVLMERQSRQMEMPLIGPLIDTSLGVTPRREYLLRNDPGGELLGHWNFDSYLATADIWPTTDVGNEFRTETANSIPVVFVHGDWDIQTPIENLLQVTPHFSNSRVLVAIHGRHSALSQVVPRVPALLEFIQSGSTVHLPTTVTLPVPRFDVPDFSPPVSLALKPPETPPWTLAKLNEPPTFEWIKTDGTVRSLLYENELYEGKPTHVFAYYATPESLDAKDAAGKRWPAVVLIHGGGGTAFREWAELWAKRGYVAIAMDLAGFRPVEGKNAHQRENRVRLPDGGPDQGDDTKFGNIDKPVTEQWPYHAVAAVIRAHSLVRSFPEVDANRTAVTGISWGGYLTCIVAGVDSRFKAAVPVYGCGFLHENSAWLNRFEIMTPDQRQRWISLWDPSGYLPAVSMPIFFVNGTNDSAYPLDSYMKSYDAVPTTKQIRITVNMPHGHPAGWAPPEIGLFIDHYLRGGTALPTLGQPQTQNGSLRLACESPVKLKQAALHCTSDGGPINKRTWQTLPMRIEGDAVSADNSPAGTTAWFITVTDERGAIVSSRVSVVGK